MAVARVALPVAAFTAFDYWIPDGLLVGRGALVRVRLAGRALAGVVVDVVATSDVAREKLQPVAEVRRDLPVLPEDVLGLAEFVARYYQEPLGLVLAQMLPPLAARSPRTSPSRRVATALRLTEPGRIALAMSLARAPRGRALYDEWTRAPQSILTASAFAALSPHQKHAVRGWEAAGWVEPVAPDGDVPGARSGPRTPGPPLNPDQVNAATAIVDAAGSFAPFPCCMALPAAARRKFIYACTRISGSRPPGLGAGAGNQPDTATRRTVRAVFRNTLVTLHSGLNEASAARTGAQA